MENFGLDQVIEMGHMVQLSVDRRSLRIRKHKFIEDHYYATLRMFNDVEKETRFTLKNCKSVKDLIEDFYSGRV